jgi:phosphatidylserine decarboxylase
MSEIIYIDRESGKQEVEKVYGQGLIKAMYGSGFLSSIASFFLRQIACKSPILSHLYGLLQKSSWSRRKIRPFIEEFQMDPSEFLSPLDSFTSFNDFFIRKLKPEARPIATGEGVAILPADARYLIYPNIQESDGFLVKGQKFSLLELLQDSALAKRYANGSMVIARLCPTDYHRFHFPCDCITGKSKLLNGVLFSVNPLALKKNIDIFSENKRVVTELKTKEFGSILYIEVGATCVGGIIQTHQADQPYKKGDEKGYFSFGGSSLILLFEQDTIRFSQDLIDVSKDRIEVKGLMGQPMGQSVHLAEFYK